MKEMTANLNQERVKAVAETKKTCETLAKKEIEEVKKKQWVRAGKICRFKKWNLNVHVDGSKAFACILLFLSSSIDEMELHSLLVLFRTSFQLI